METAFGHYNFGFRKIWYSWQHDPTMSVRLAIGDNVTQLQP